MSNDTNNKKDIIASMFPRAYPVEELPSRERSMLLTERPTPDTGNLFQILVSRSNFNDMIIGAADVGRQVIPSIYSEDSFFNNRFPEAYGSSWTTKFDGGEREECLPTIVVALFAEANIHYTEGGQSNRPYPFVENVTVWAKVIARSKTKIILEKFVAVKNHKNYLVDDGLELVYQAIQQVINHDALLKREEIKEEVVESLDWTTHHILQSFGQGKLPRLKLK